MKVLLLVDKWTDGGVPRIIVNICVELAKNGDDFKIITYKEAPDKTITILNTEYNITGLNASLIKAPSVFYQLNKIVNNYQPDVIHDHYGGIWAGCYLFHSKWAQRAIYHVHNEFRVIPDSPDKKRGVRTYLFLKGFINRYRKIIAISRHVKHTLVENSTAKTENIDVVYNSINQEAFMVERSDNEDIREMLRLDNYDIVIGSVARFVYEKGFDVIVRVLSNLRQQGVEAAALLVGSGDKNYENRVFSLANREGIKKHCYFTGRRENIVDYLQAMDCFMFCSRQEPFGITLLEAMACKVPIIATRQPLGGGPDEFLNHQQNALIFELEQVKEMAGAVLEINRDIKQREKLLEGARQTLKNFSNTKMFKKLEKIYQTVNNDGSHH